MSGSNDPQSAGLLAPLANPLGKVLNTALKPTLGAITGAIGEPTGEAMLNLEKQAKQESAYTGENKKESEWWGGKKIGGKEQTDGNPLGL